MRFSRQGLQGGVGDLGVDGGLAAGLVPQDLDVEGLQQPRLQLRREAGQDVPREGSSSSRAGSVARGVVAARAASWASSCSRSAVMAAQLARIADMAAQPNVTGQVLPFTAGAHPAMLGSFTLMQFPDPADKDVVYLEAETGALYLEKPQDVRRYSLMIDYLRAQALGPAETRALIAQLAQQSPD